MTEPSVIRVLLLAVLVWRLAVCWNLFVRHWPGWKHLRRWKSVLAENAIRLIGALLGNAGGSGVWLMGTGMDRLAVVWAMIVRWKQQNGGDRAT